MYGLIILVISFFDEHSEWEKKMHKVEKISFFSVQKYSSIGSKMNKQKNTTPNILLCINDMSVFSENRFVVFS